MSRKVRIAVLVSGGGTNLQALIDAQQNGIIVNGEIALVVSSKPEVFALSRAKKAEIKNTVIERASFKDDVEAFSHAIKCVLIENNIELVVLAGFMSILTPAFINAFQDRILNVHPSLIPSFCGKGFYGLKVHEAALNYGVKLSGATVFIVNNIVDGGRIISQKAVAVKEGDTPESLQKRIMEEAEWVILPEAVEKVCKELVI
ncbi:MAG: phosphoribosylglycinamide formyltransferase [Clostridia bacterium]|jgi:phosphoribosylglycinamide formyltransferase-1|nr:phosphoribosylglycinamide formyltransferase [Clostridia bacterium]